MKSEKVNENTLRVFIYQEDLKKRGMETINLMGDQEAVEEFFFSILEEVDGQDFFGETDMLTFQVRPLGNSLELLITKSNFDSEELKGKMQEIPKEFASDRAMREHFQGLIEQSFGRGSLDESDEDEDEEEEREFISELVLSFESFEDFIALSKEVKLTALKSDLYVFEGRYYAIVYDNLAFKKGHDRIEDDLAWVAEYGQTVAVHPDVLKEHGRCILKENAIKEVKRKFKK